ncbi:MAG: GGDEF domain-containing protein [Gammaproteobacteria bacterium]|nr:GGDEF domain-containing protein [Gammaproteobacteria bacterium]
MARLTAYEKDSDLADAELHRVLRSVTEVDGLLLALTLLYLIAAPAAIEKPSLYMGAMVAYGVLVLGLRHAPLFAELPRGKIIVGVLLMVLFITGLLAASGGASGPLANLYLLPIVTSALTLGRGPTVLVLATALAARAGLIHFVAGEDVLTLSSMLMLLAEGVPVLLVALLTSMLATDIQDARERLQAHTQLDGVTGLLNLEAFTRLVDEETRRAERRGVGFALLVVDIDGLQSVNERFGHEAGNGVLRSVSQVLRRSSRSVDLVGRYGGDEFLMFLSGAGQPIARAVANRIRHGVSTTTLETGGAMHRVGVGIGVAQFPADGRDLRELVNAAHRALGKDRHDRRPLEEIWGQ